MNVRIHEHAQERMNERGATRDEVVLTVQSGERFPAKHGRTGFRRNHAYNSTWRGRAYATKQVEAIAIEEPDAWLVLTVMVKFF